MRVSQDQECGVWMGGVPVSHDGGWFMVAETMGRGRSEYEGLKRRPGLAVRPAVGPVAGPKGAMALRMDLSGVRLERVMQLRAAIAKGRYRVSATDLTDRMVARLMEAAMITGRG